MTALVDSARALRHAVWFAVDELSSIYTWQSWLFGWAARVVTQVIFYALIGILLDDPAQVQFLLVGNVVLMAASNVMLAIPSTQWERYAGTLPLLVAAPSKVLWVFLGRSVEWFADGLGTSLLALLIAAPLFDVPLPWPGTVWVVALMLLVIVASYGVATYLGALVLRRPDLRNIVSNTTIGVMAIVTGANVPVEFFPAPVQWLAQLFPLTHGLAAVRHVFAGAPGSAVLSDAGWCAVLGAAWLVTAGLAFERFAEAGRRDGSIEFG